MRAKEFITDASYPGNIGAMEVAKFFMKATPEQKEILKKLMALNDYKRAWAMIQSVTGVKLQGKEFATENLSDDLDLDEGLVDFIKPYVEKAKDKIMKLRNAVKQEWWETGLMWEIIQKGTAAKDHEIEFANKQFKDMLKGAGLGAWYALPIPGNTLWITMVEKLLNKFGISIMPDEIKKQVFSGMYENFADGKNPGRKGLSKRVGIPKKASLGQLQKIASSSTGERRRMAQWQLNMRRGKKK
jgi:hypothetical protein